MEEMTNDLVQVIATETAPQDATIAELDRRIRELENALGDLRSIRAEGAMPGRKTLPAGQVSLLAKGAAQDHSSVDDALRSLSVEQRIAVKSGLLRAGLLP